MIRVFVCEGERNLVIGRMDIEGDAPPQVMALTEEARMAFMAAGSAAMRLSTGPKGFVVAEVPWGTSDAPTKISAPREEAAS